MALLSVDFFSDALEVGTSMTVVLPQPTREQIGVAGAGSDDGLLRATGFPVLYLLHGLSDDHTAWLRYTSVERYAAAAGLAVVMPAVHRSFYADEAHGHAYWQFVSEELPRVVADFFAVSTHRDDTFVAGLSMGGYGALKLGLRQPERFAAAASLSGVADLPGLMARDERDEILHRVFDGQVGPRDDLARLLAPDSDGAPRPRLWIGCGTDEPVFIGPNRELARRAAEAGYDVTTDWRPGEHTWQLWDEQLPLVVDWITGIRREQAQQSAR